MYYYILEQPKSRNVQVAQDKIKNILENVGIAGEIVTVSPARTTEELVEMGLFKQYNTIVAVGSDRHINKIATGLRHKNCAMGIIPINTSDLIYKLIGTTDLKEACENLKFRRLREINMGLIEPNKYFITQAEIQTNVSREATVTIINPGSDSYQAESTFSEIIISRSLYIFISDKYKDSNFLKNTWNWFTGNKTEESVSSILRGKKIKIETNEPMPVTMDGEIIAKTPIVAALLPRVLNVITKPARIKQEENKFREADEKTKNQ